MSPRSATFEGVAASPGIAIGTVLTLSWDDMRVPERSIPAESVEAEVQRFEAALLEAGRELGEIRDAYSSEMGEEAAQVLDAQLLLLTDVMVRDATVEDIRREHKNAAFLFKKVLASARHHLENVANEYMRERATDVMDVERRVLHHLLARSAPGLRDLSEPVVLVARDVPPSETVLMRPGQVLGFALESGGRTSHSVIVARSRGIPAVVCVPGICRAVRDGDTLVLDGNEGRLELNPDEATLERYRRKKREFEEFEQRLEATRRLPAVTMDGRRIAVMANIETPDEAGELRARGAEGVGLYRTEFFYLDHASLPSEEDQLRAYRRVAEAVAPDPVVVRTIDVGGDKVASYMGATPEENPFRGWRGIRYSLAHEDIFRVQLRAIYRASAFGQLQIMIPMVTQVGEVLRTRELCRQVMEELTREGHAFAADVPLGIMVETPAAVLMADHLARHSDFFSIGSNDLLQFTLAVDRGNERASKLYEPLDVAVLRAIRLTVQAGHRRGFPISVCGEMSNDPLACVALVGLGVDKISTSPFGLPSIKSILRSIAYEEAHEWMEDAVRLESASQVRAFLTERLPQATEILSWGTVPGRKTT
ncbi:MAG: phosphoenolpyruvate--protein phosphotransferase [Candidatus Eisenbacteria bacterium]|nr:phosphoenolpyruvate--protein phosphotransferase [Candidatus Eisenbacteria bacterium]